MCGIICDVITYCVRSLDIDKIVTENLYKERKDENQENIK